MTISKKLLLIATLACNIPFVTSAHFDAVHLKDEVATILNYVSTLRLHAANHPENTVRTECTNIIQWLETKLENTDWQTSLESFHIVALANVIKNSVGLYHAEDAPIEETIAKIQNIITNKNAEETRQQQERLAMQRKHRNEAILSIGAMVGLLSAMSYVASVLQQQQLYGFERIVKQMIPTPFATTSPQQTNTEFVQTNPIKVELVEGRSK